MTHPKIIYRPDIDGLRAIAVLAVVGFHLFPESIVAGFVGVDIFFVISGFLITQIIQRELADGTFTFRGFYARRIKRIFPALLLVMATSLIAGWFLLFPTKYAQLGKHVLAGATFVSNFVLRAEGGYFDSSHYTKPFLHLWSLAIEEQFYIIWPLFLWMFSGARHVLYAGTAALLLGSFYANIHTIETSPISAFFLPHTRFWELGTGAAIAYFFRTPDPLAMTTSEKGNRNLLSLLGALFLCFSISMLSGDSFPGGWALAPTGGAAFIICAGQQAWLNRHVLSNRILVLLGLISYPLYLWHWVLIAFARMTLPTVEMKTLALPILAASLALAWLTYSVVEKPVRHSSSRNLPLILLGLMIILGLAGCVCYVSEGRMGQPERYRAQNEFLRYFDNAPPALRYAKAHALFEQYGIECDFYDIEQWRLGQSTNLPRARIENTCFERNPGLPHSVFIWGDSHAQHLRPGLKAYLPHSWQLLQVTSSGCLPAIVNGIPSAKNFCEVSNAFALQSIMQAKPDVVLVAQNDGHNLATMLRLESALHKAGVKKIIFAGPTPRWITTLPDVIVSSLWPNPPERTWIGADQAVMETNHILRKNLHERNILYADVIAAFCTTQGCLTRLGSDVKESITSMDYGHLTPLASQFLAQTLLIKMIID